MKEKLRDLKIWANICPREDPEDRTETMENNNNNNKWTFSNAKERHKPLDWKGPPSTLNGTKRMILIYSYGLNNRSENILTLYVHNDRFEMYKAKTEKYKGILISSQKSPRLNRQKLIRALLQWFANEHKNFLGVLLKMQILSTPCPL